MKKLWIDAATPKYALFFAEMIPHFHTAGWETMVTTRWSEGYQEAKRMLELSGIPHHVTGNYGGASVLDKFRARLHRQNEFLTLFEQYGTPDALLCGSVVDSIHTAYGVGMPVINFCDTPLKTYNYTYSDITVVSRLTLHQSSLILYPDVIPAEVFPFMGVDPAITVPYDFIDVSLWMDKIVAKPENDIRTRYNLSPDKPTILFREEEYKAHYVSKKLDVMYQLLEKLRHDDRYNIIIMPRYESDYLKKSYGDFAVVLEEKLRPEQFYPFIDLLVGGGGTMNLEAAFFGIPVVSLRSIHLFHDRYLMDNGMMFWTNDAAEAFTLIEQKAGKKSDNRHYFLSKKGGITFIVNSVLEYLNRCAE